MERVIKKVKHFIILNGESMKNDLDFNTRSNAWAWL